MMQENRPMCNPEKGFCEQVGPFGPWAWIIFYFCLLFAISDIYKMLDMSALTNFFLSGTLIWVGIFVIIMFVLLPYGCYKILQFSHQVLLPRIIIPIRLELGQKILNLCIIIFGMLFVLISVFTANLIF